MNALNERDLALYARQLRKAKGLRQQELADEILGVSTGEPITRQSIGRAENPESGSALNGLRLRIIEHLDGKTIRGPYWLVDSTEEGQAE